MTEPKGPGAPDLEGAIDRERAFSDEPPQEPRKKRGRPPGSKTKTKKATSRPAVEEEDSPEQIEAEIQAYTFLSFLLWKSASRLLNTDPLTEEEARQLGEAIRPVALKYLPGLTEWQAEINLGLVVVGLIYSKQKAPEPVTLPVGAIPGEPATVN